MSQLNFFLLKLAYNYADKIVALSDGVSNDLINLYNLEASKIVTIYNPVNVKKINDSVNLYNKQENRYTSNKTNKVRLVACGRLVPQKNFVLLIKSLAIVDKHFKDWELDILGEGPELETLKSLADSNNIANKINFCGFVKEPYLRMANSDIFVLSSKWEGFGHVIVESMAAGTPVLATDCPHGPREILKDGKYGWLVKNDDVVDLSRQLLFLLNNENEINRMKSKIFERAMDFESSNIVKLYEDVF